MTKFVLISETKKSISDNIVRHCLVVMSAKASVVLRYFSRSVSDREIHHNISKGLIFFSGESFIKIPKDNLLLSSENDFSYEVIALFPKVLLSAYATSDGMHVIRSERALKGHYTHTSKQCDAEYYFEELRSIAPTIDQKENKQNISGSSPFHGGLAGFIGYDLAAAQFIDIPNHDHNQTEQLIAAMGDYDIYLKKESAGWALYGPNDSALNPIYRIIIDILQSIEAETIQETDPYVNAQASEVQLLEPFKPTWTVDQYQSAFKRIQAYLRSGDCYQVNLTQPFVAKINGDLVFILDDLLELTKAPYSGYMRVGEHELLTCSPELFLSFSGIKADGHNQVITRPIKGTRPRSIDTELDEIERNALTHSEKDHSENLMIVDLLRHDLSRHAVIGSVEVPALFELESFAQVHHLVSEIRATLREDVSALDVLIDALPGGSITGAPKIRAMEIIAELEAMPRGAYCGSFGYLNRDGSGQFNVLIRTLQKYQENLVAWAGGGITIASDVDAEYQECLDKISAILNCVNGFGNS
jgi:para-aminobenzoate synthetase component 1